MKILHQYYLLFFSLLCTSVMQSMEKDSVPQYDKSEILVIDPFITYICQNTGTPELLNKPDLPVIIETLKLISLVNKYCYAKINTKECVTLITDQLKKRFKIDDSKITRKLITLGVACWTEWFINSEMYMQFNLLHKIVNIAHDLSSLLLKAGLLDKVKYNGINHIDQNEATKQGFFISNSHQGSESGDLEIYTPWGPFKPIVIEGSKLGVRFFYESFFRHIQKIEVCEDVKKLFKSETPVYQLIKVDGTVLPSAEFLSESPKGRDVELCIFEHLYLQNQKGENKDIHELTRQFARFEIAHAQSKLQKSLCITCAKNKGILSCVFCPENASIKYCSKECQKNGWESHALLHEDMLNNKFPYALELQLAMTIDEVLPLYQSLFNILLEKKWVASSFDPRCKTISLRDKTDHKILLALFKSSEKKPEQWTHFNVQEDYVGGLNALCLFLHNNLECWEDSKFLTACGNYYAEQFAAVIHKLQHGWQPARLLDHPELINEHSEETWQLYIHNTSEYSYRALINSIAKKFGVEQYIDCETSCLEADKHQIWMWIEKKHFDKVQKVFNFVGLEHPNKTLEQDEQKQPVA